MIPSTLTSTLPRLCVALVCLALLSGNALADAIRIDTPQRGAVVYDISGNLFVEAELAEADLQPDMRFRLLIDGERAARDGYVPVFRLYDVPAGEHWMQMLIVDRHGEVLERSDPHTFTMVHGAGPYDD